jgi:hypothetical protein
MQNVLPDDDEPLVLASGIRTRADAAGHVLIELDIGQELVDSPGDSHG